MSNVLRVKPPLTLGDIDARLKPLHDFWRLRRWRVLRPALVEPAPAKAIAGRLGWSVLTVRALLEASKRHGPNARETTGKGRRQHASLAVDAERTGLAPFLEESHAGPMAIGRTIKKAFADALGPRGAPSTVYRLLHRHPWRQGVPRPQNPRRSQEAQAPLKKTFPSSASKSWQHVRLMRRVRSSAWPKRQDGLDSCIPCEAGGRPNRSAPLSPGTWSVNPSRSLPPAAPSAAMAPPDCSRRSIAT